MRLIDGHALMESLQKATSNSIKPDFEKGLLEAQRLTINAPTIEALKDRPQGEWTDIDNYYRMATCSHCHKVTMFEKWGEYTKPYNFCPNCGARMKGGDTE